MNSSLPTFPRLLRATDLARLMQVSVRTVWRLRSSSSLPAPIRVGRSVRWNRDEIEQWMANGCPEQGQTSNGRSR